MPKDISELQAENIRVIFFDIDDTLSSEGKIRPEAYAAMWKLKEAGKVIVPITGRPAGWCDHIARMWPVEAIVGENGAFYFMMKEGRMQKRYTADKSRREEFKRGLEKIRDEILSEVPSAGISSDQDYREFELAIDFCEDIPRLSEADIEKVEEIFKRHGATTKISSIHINGWFGDYNKLTTAKIFAKNELGIEVEKENRLFTFCGDSPNDEPMFDFFDLSVGVANVMDFANRIKSMPKFITKSKSGKGFAELADKIIGAGCGK